MPFPKTQQNQIHAVHPSQRQQDDANSKTQYVYGLNHVLRFTAPANCHRRVANFCRTEADNKQAIDRVSRFLCAENANQEHAAASSQRPRDCDHDHNGQRKVDKVISNQHANLIPAFNPSTRVIPIPAAVRSTSHKVDRGALIHITRPAQFGKRGQHKKVQHAGDHQNRADFDA